MNEHGFIKSITNKLPKEIYRWKIQALMNNGVPDCYFSGPAGDLWVEFKFIKLPKRESTLIKPNLSALQLKWLDGRYDEGRTVAVIIGSNINSAILIDKQWYSVITNHSFVFCKQDIVKWIESQTLG